MNFTFEYVKGKNAIYKPGDQVAGFVSALCHRHENVTSVSVNFRGEVLASLGVANWARDVFFSRDKRLWSGQFLSPGKREFYFEFQFPLMEWLPPSCYQKVKYGLCEVKVSILP